MTPDWERVVQERLPVFGHRNWIVVADSAYPVQASAGIETIAAPCDIPTALASTLKLLETAPHLTATVYIDRELRFIAEHDAPGVSRYRSALDRQVASLARRELPHEEIIAKLDHASRVFRILIVKTTTTIPYTSIFLELGCGYWTPEAEGRLRDAMDRSK